MIHLPASCDYPPQGLETCNKFLSMRATPFGPKERDFFRCRSTGQNVDIDALLEPGSLQGDTDAVVHMLGRTLLNGLFYPEARCGVVLHRAIEEAVFLVRTLTEIANNTCRIHHSQRYFVSKR